MCRFERRKHFIFLFHLHYSNYFACTQLINIVLLSKQRKCISIITFCISMQMVFSVKFLIWLMTTRLGRNWSTVTSTGMNFRGEILLVEFLCQLFHSALQWSDVLSGLIVWVWVTQPLSCSLSSSFWDEVQKIKFFLHSPTKARTS